MAAALAVAATTIASANDDIIYAPDPIASQSTGFVWTGGYAGVQLGMSKISATGDYDGSGVSGGVHAGGLWQFNKFVIGAEVDADASNVEIDGVRFDRFLRARLKAGIAIDKALISTSLGVVRSGITAEIAPGLTLAGEGNGWIAGIGMDYAVTDKIILGGEYLHQQFDEFNNSPIDITARTFRARASYKF